MAMDAAGETPAAATGTVAPPLKLVHADAMDYLREHQHWSGWKLVANLPFSVASTLLVQLAQAEEPPERMVATLQLEVARRIDAAPGANDYGVLGLLLRLRYQWLGWFKIPASCFFPAPGWIRRASCWGANRAAAARAAARRISQNGQARLFATAQNDVQTPQTGLAPGAVAARL